MRPRRLNVSPWEARYFPRLHAWRIRVNVIGWKMALDNFWVWRPFEFEKNSLVVLLFGISTLFLSLLSLPFLSLSLSIFSLSRSLSLPISLSLVLSFALEERGDFPFKIFLLALLYCEANISRSGIIWNTLVREILTPTYFRLTSKHVRCRSVYLRNLGNHRPERYRLYYMHKARDGERRGGVVSISSRLLATLSRSSLLSLTPSLPLSLALAPIPVHETFLVKSLRRFH